MTSCRSKLYAEFLRFNPDLKIKNGAFEIVVLLQTYLNCYSVFGNERSMIDVVLRTAGDTARSESHMWVSIDNVMSAILADKRIAMTAISAGIITPKMP